MKKLLLLTALLVGLTKAQNFTSAGEFFSFFVQHMNNIVDANMDYVAKSVHSDNDNKIEKRRLEVIDNLNIAIRSFGGANFKGGEEMKAEALAVVKIYKATFEQDYANVNQLQAKSQDGYEFMQRYFEAQEKANAKLRNASAHFDTIQEKFAAANNINLIKNEDKASQKMELAGRVMKYQRQVYLSYFRVYKDNGRFLDAMAAGKPDEMKKQLDSLNKHLPITQAELGKMGAFEGEGGYLQATVATVNYIRTMTQGSYPKLIAIKEKDSKTYTQQEVDTFNKIIQDLNTNSAKNTNAMNVAQDKLLSKMVARKF